MWWSWPELGWTQDMVTTRSVVPTCRERAGGGGPVSSNMNREQYVDSVTPPPPLTLSVHVCYTGHGLIPAAARWPSEAGYRGWVERHHAGADGTWRHCCGADAGMLGTLCGHSVEPGEGRNQRRVCEESVDTDNEGP